MTLILTPSCGKVPKSDLNPAERSAVALLIREHLRTTRNLLAPRPAMHFGIADHIWTIDELVDVALSDNHPELPRRCVPFTVIRGRRA